MSDTRPPRFARSPHLVDLVAEVERLGGLLRAAQPEARARLADRRRDEAALATLHLDGSTASEIPDDATLDAASAAAADDAAGADGRGDPRRVGTWLDAMRAVEDPSDAQIHALEVAGARRALAADDLAEPLLQDPDGTLRELHARLTAGLVAPARAGRPREIDQAVHDASVGRILYFATAPDAIARELALLGAWLTSAGAREHGLLLAGVLHLELLRIHPFDAANGRLARTAARLVLRARGLDPDGLAVPEPALAEDALGYYEEVARTMRRRDVTIWLERWGEAVTAGLRESVRALGGLTAAAPERARTALATVPLEAGRFTVADYRAAAGVGPEDARADLQALLDAGTVARVPGARGLRYRRVEIDADVATD